MERTINLDLLKAHLTIIILSGFLKGVHALSTLIIAWQEHAKSVEVLKLRAIGCLVISDCTAWGIQKIFDEEQKKGRKRFHHIVIPDLERLNARGQKVKAEILAVFKLLMAEGIGNVRTKFIKFDLGKDPYQAGLIMCVTPDDMHPRSAIHNISFLSRLIPFSYEFTNGEKENIIEFILSEENRIKELSKIASKTKLEVSIPDKYKPYLKIAGEKLAQTMNEYCGHWVEYEVIDKDGNKDTRRKKIILDRLFGTRAITYYLTYLKAIALKNHPDSLTVNDADYAEFEQLEQYFNFNLIPLPETPQKSLPTPEPTPQISESKAVSEPKKHFWTRKPKEEEEKSLTYA
jgi:hypothetical protein